MELLDTVVDIDLPAPKEPIVTWSELAECVCPDPCECDHDLD